jgi:hypothetical protein
MTKAEAKAAADRAAAAAATNLYVVFKVFYFNQASRFILTENHSNKIRSNKRFQQTQAQVDEVRIKKMSSSLFFAFF